MTASDNTTMGAASPQILVVEDNDAIRSLIEMVLGGLLAGPVDSV